MLYVITENQQNYVYNDEEDNKIYNISDDIIIDKYELVDNKE